MVSHGDIMDVIRRGSPNAVMRKHATAMAVRAETIRV
jgi:hypothetical protein